MIMRRTHFSVIQNSSKLSKTVRDEERPPPMVESKAQPLKEIKADPPTSTPVTVKQTAYKRFVERFADEATFHGVKQIYDARGCGRIFWTLLTLGALAGLLVQLQFVGVKYWSEGTGVTLSEISDTEQPAVSVCPTHWVNSTSAGSYNLTETSVSIINGFLMLAGVEQLYDFGAQHISNVFDRAQMIYGGAEMTKVINFWKANNNSIKNVVDALKGSILDVANATSYPSRNRMQKESVIAWSGVCLKFDGMAERSNNGQEMMTGSIIRFYHPEALGPDIYKDEPQFRVALTPSGKIDMESATDTVLKYGAEYTLTYSVVSTSRLSTRSWPCKDDQTPGDNIHCRTRYMNQVIKKVGGCETVLPRSNIYEEQTTPNPCNFFVSMADSSLIKSANLSISRQEWNEICPRPCSYKIYQFSYRKKRDMSQNGEASADFTLLEVKPQVGISGIQMTEYLLLGMEDMLSYVGGTIGLWIGASMISVVQVFYLICANCGKSG